MTIAARTSGRSGPFDHAGPVEPWLSVHVLAQFAYCPRAGMIAFEKKQVSEDEPEDHSRNRAKRFSWRSVYLTAQMIDRDLRHANRLWTKWIIGGVLAGIVTLAMLRSSPGPGAALGVFAVIACLWKVSEAGTRARTLARLRARATGTPASRPPDGCNEQVQTDWWALLASGFDVRASGDEPLRDRARGLDGGPWRVLIDGGTRVPVFLCRRTTGVNARRVFGNDIVRLAAYCHLLEVSEGCRSPYGVILYPDDYTCTVIPHNPHARHLFFDALRRARDTISRGDDPGLPRAGSKVCHGCEFGKPFAVGGPTPPGVVRLSVHGNPVVGDDGRAYRSDCGDLFRWTPPHEKARRKGLNTRGF